MRRASMPRLAAWSAVPVIALCLACAADSPTMPERHGIPQVTIVCAAGAAQITLCRAPVGCSLYPCAAGTPTDVTDVAAWSVDDPTVAAVTAPGVLRTVGLGHTVVRVTWSFSSYFIAIGVFPGTAPLPTYEYEGMIYDGGGPPRTPIDGARVEILTGVGAGRWTTSGGMPESLPGATVVAFPGHYAFFGLPADTYRLRVSKAGYVTQEIETRQFADVTLLRSP